MALNLSGQLQNHAEMQRLASRYVGMLNRLEAQAGQRPLTDQRLIRLNDTIKAHVRELGAHLRTLRMADGPIDCGEGLCWDGEGCVPCDL
jgi:hypothetical protein